MTYGDVFEVLHAAIANNIQQIDTSYLYGDAEHIIGDFIQQYPEYESFSIVSKQRCEKAAEIRSKVEESIDALHVDQLHGLLIHDFMSYIKNPCVWDELVRIKDDDITDCIGFSLYHPYEIQKILSDGVIPDLIEIPYNVFDQRFRLLIPLFETYHIHVHIRSVYLQGILVQQIDQLPSFFSPLSSKLKQFRFLCEQYNVSLLSAALNFVCKTIHADQIIIGVDNKDQVYANADVFNKRIPVGLLDRLQELFVFDERFINPMNWRI